MNVSLVSAIRLLHLVALALAVGGATAKNLLLVKCRKDHAFLPTFLAIEKPVTAQIIVGQVSLAITGIAYALTIGYGFSPRLIVKVVLLASLFVLGPAIDNVVGPALRKNAPGPGAVASPAFVKALNRYVFWDLVATGIFFAIIVLWSVMA